MEIQAVGGATAPEPVNLMDPATFGRSIPHDWFDWLRENDPVHWNEPYGRDGMTHFRAVPQGFWALTRHADVSHVSRHPEVFSSHEGGALMEDMGPEGLAMFRQQLIHMDPPEHTEFRHVLSKGFTPRRIRRLEAFIDELCRDIVDSVAPLGECDFVDMVAKELPVRVIGELFGMPRSDFAKLIDWTNRVLGIDDPEGDFADGLAAMQELFHYVTMLGEEKRRDPDGTVISALVNSEVDGRPMTAAEINMWFFLLVIAGNETTRNAISGGLIALTEFPDQRRKLLDDMSLLKPMADEMVRWVSPVIAFRRTALVDTEIDGHPIAEGDKVVVFYPAANRDPRVFSDPHEFDVTRDPNPHLGFGVGNHFCLGANLARAEIIAMYRELLTRLPDIEVAGPPARWHSTLVNSIKSLPCRFTPH